MRNTTSTDSFTEAKGKKCTRCGCTKPLWRFLISKSGRYSSRCVECSKNTNRKISASRPKSTCIKCGEEKDLSTFFKSRHFDSKSKVKTLVCGDCRSESRKINQFSRIAAQSNASAGSTRGKLSKEDVKMRMAMTGNRCKYCGDIASGVDHMIPLSKGGLNIPSNIVACCTECNRRKKDKILVGNEITDFITQMRERRYM